MRFGRTASALVACIGLAGSVGMAAYAEEAPARPLLTEVREIQLPPVVRWAQDLRWQSDGTVLISAVKDGIYGLALDGGVAKVASQQLEGARQGGFWFSSRLGLSEKWLVVAAPIGSIGWRSRQAGSLQETSFAAVVDLDVFGDRVAVLGAQRGDDQSWMPGGSMAWLGSLPSPPARWTALYSSISPAGPEAMDACAILETGAVRFLADGSLLLLPGVEPGVFLYGSDGRLRRTWQSDALGIFSGCDVDERYKYVISADLDARRRWLNQRAIVDEVVPVGSGAGLLVRRFFKGRTQWDLVLLAPDGSVARHHLPVSSPSPWARIKAATRGGEVLFLLTEPSPAETPEHGPRLIRARWQVNRQ